MFTWSTPSIHNNIHMKQKVSLNTVIPSTLHNVVLYSDAIIVVCCHYGHYTQNISINENKRIEEARTGQLPATTNITAIQIC